MSVSIESAGQATAGRAPGMVAVLGAGPAGLTAAYELSKRAPGTPMRIFEAGEIVGGISRTESHNGYRFDIGGHRFFTKVGEVEHMWHEVMGHDMLTRPRLSRIYYRGKFYYYPLRLFDALGNIGPIESLRIMGSYAYRQMRPRTPEVSFEDWVVNRFGDRLYMHFFESYTEKVWGIPPREIRADWAAQRIKNLSLYKAVKNAITGANDTASLIEEFKYPRLGPGQMWETVRDRLVEQGAEVHMRHRVTRVAWEGRRVTAVEAVPEDGGAPVVLQPDQVVSTLAIRDLIDCMDPQPPAEVRAAADKLRYRDFLIVVLILDHEDPFPDNWIYVHNPDVNVGRIQNFRAWSPDMVPNPGTSSIGLEYFCNVGDAIWEKNPEQLRDMAAKELELLGLAPASSVIDFAIIRQPKAYPVYDGDYQDALDVVRDWLLTLENFQTVGRNGLHRYNNQDHSMLTAMLAARNIAGERHDVWSVNLERSYHEEFQVKAEDKEKADASQRAA